MKKSVKIVSIVVLIIVLIVVIFWSPIKSILSWIQIRGDSVPTLGCMDVNMEITNARWNQTSESISYDVLRKAGGPFLNATIIHVINGAMKQDLTGEIGLGQLTSSSYSSPNNAYPVKPSKIQIAARFTTNIGKNYTCEISAETINITTI